MTMGIIIIWNAIIIRSWTLDVKNPCSTLCGEEHVGMAEDLDGLGKRTLRMAWRQYKGNQLWTPSLACTSLLLEQKKGSIRSEGQNRVSRPQAHSHPPRGLAAQAQGQFRDNAAGDLGESFSRKQCREALARAAPPSLGTCFEAEPRSSPWSLPELHCSCTAAVPAHRLPKTARRKDLCHHVWHWATAETAASYNVYFSNNIWELLTVPYWPGICIFADRCNTI